MVLPALVVIHRREEATTEFLGEAVHLFYFHAEDVGDFGRPHLVFKSHCDRSESLIARRLSVHDLAELLDAVVRFGRCQRAGRHCALEPVEVQRLIRRAVSASHVVSASNEVADEAAHDAGEVSK